MDTIEIPKDYPSDGSLSESGSSSSTIPRRLIEQNKTKQNKTKQNKTKQNKLKQNKTKQTNFFLIFIFCLSSFFFFLVRLHVTSTLSLPMLMQDTQFVVNARFFFFFFFSFPFPLSFFFSFSFLSQICGAQKCSGYVRPDSGASCGVCQCKPAKHINIGRHNAY